MTWIRKMWCRLFHRRMWLESPISVAYGGFQWSVSCLACGRKWEEGNVQSISCRPNAPLRPGRF